MKNLIILLFCIICLCSCGRRNDCKNRETAVLECRAVNQPNYGYQYAQEMCNRSYSSDRCY